MDQGEEHVLHSIMLECLPPIHHSFPDGVTVGVLFCVMPEGFPVTENILALDFLQDYGCVMDFRSLPPHLYLRHTDHTLTQHLRPKLSSSHRLCLPVQCMTETCPQHYFLLDSGSTFNYVDESFAVNHGLLQVHTDDHMRLGLLMGWHGYHVK